MGLNIHKKNKLNVSLSLVVDENGTTVVAKDENGNIVKDGELLQIHPHRTFSLYPGVNPTLGFILEGDGKIRTFVTTSYTQATYKFDNYSKEKFTNKKCSAVFDLEKNQRGDIKLICVNNDRNIFENGNVLIFRTDGYIALFEGLNDKFGFRLDEKTKNSTSSTYIRQKIKKCIE